MMGYLRSSLWETREFGFGQAVWHLKACVPGSGAQEL